jgi:hypothetical protein
MFASVRRVLTPGGVLAINHVGRPRGFATACLVRTLRAVFAHVEVFATEPGDDVQFLAVFASDAPLRLPETPEQVWNRTHPGDTLPAPPFASIEARRVLVPPDAGAVVTDDRHPAERDWAEVSRAWREKTRRLLGAM